LAERIPARLTPAEGRRFAFPVAGAFLTLAALLWWRDKEVAWKVAAALGAALALAGTVAPAALGPVQRAWMGLAHAISKVTTPIFLGVMYFGVITPAGLLMRLVGRRALVHRAAEDSYWQDPPSGGRSDLERQF